MIRSACKWYSINFWKWSSTNSTLCANQSEGSTLSGEAYQCGTRHLLQLWCKVYIGETTRRDWRLGLRNIGMHAWSVSPTGQPSWSMIGPRSSLSTGTRQKCWTVQPDRATELVWRVTHPDDSSLNLKLPTQPEWRLQMGCRIAYLEERAGMSNALTDLIIWCNVERVAYYKCMHVLTRSFTFTPRITRVSRLKCWQAVFHCTQRIY